MTKLYVLTIVITNRAADVELVYNDEARARAVETAIHGALSNSAPFNLVDDYGRRVRFLRPSTIDCVMFRDIAEELNGRSAIDILTQHANIDHGRRVQSDQKIAAAQTILRAAQPNAGGMPIFGRGN